MKDKKIPAKIWKELQEGLEELEKEGQRRVLLNLLKHGQCFRMHCGESCPVRSYEMCYVFATPDVKEVDFEKIKLDRYNIACKEYLLRFGEESLFEEML